MSVMELLGLLGQASINKLGEEGQKKAARFAYQVYYLAERAAGRSPKQWEDLTQREQMRWLAAVGDIIEKGYVI